MGLPPQSLELQVSCAGAWGAAKGNRRLCQRLFQLSAAVRYLRWLVEICASLCEFVREFVWFLSCSATSIDLLTAIMQTLPTRQRNILNLQPYTCTNVSSSCLPSPDQRPRSGWIFPETGLSFPAGNWRNMQRAFATLRGFIHIAWAWKLYLLTRYVPKQSMAVAGMVWPVVWHDVSVNYVGDEGWWELQWEINAYFADAPAFARSRRCPVVREWIISKWMKWNSLAFKMTVENSERDSWRNLLFFVSICSVYI